MVNMWEIPLKLSEYVSLSTVGFCGKKIIKLVHTFSQPSYTYVHTQNNNFALSNRFHIVYISQYVSDTNKIFLRKKFMKLVPASIYP